MSNIILIIKNNIVLQHSITLCERWKCAHTPLILEMIGLMSLISSDLPKQFCSRWQTQPAPSNPSHPFNMLLPSSGVHEWIQSWTRVVSSPTPISRRPAFVISDITAPVCADSARPLQIASLVCNSQSESMKWTITANREIPFSLQISPIVNWKLMC